MLVRAYEEADRDGLVELVRAVAALGGAVGWLEVPSPEEVDDWQQDLTGRAELLVAVDGDGYRVLACGAWSRQTAAVTRHLGTISKVMTHPEARGRGAAKAVCTALIDRCRAEGLELLMLDVRGNNHGAMQLYAGLGFVTTGRRPDALAIGDERFDQVLMHLDLRVGTAGLHRHGSRSGGPGST